MIPKRHTSRTDVQHALVMVVSCLLVTAVMMGATTPIVAADESDSSSDAVDEGVVQYSNLTVSASTVNVSESVTVSATVTNLGNSTLTHRVPLHINGSVTSSQPLTIPPGEDVTIDFTAEFMSTGTHSVAIGSLSPQQVQVQFGPQLTRTGRTYTSEPLSDLVETVRDETPASLPPNSFVLMADGESYLVFTSESQSLNQVITVNAQRLAIETSMSDEFTPIVIPPAQSETDPTAIEYEPAATAGTAPSVSKLEASAVKPGEQTSIQAEARNVDLALFGVPEGWGVNVESQVNNCGVTGLQDGSCEILFVVPLTSDGGVDIVSNVIKDLIPTDPFGVVEGIIDLILGTISAPLSDLISQLFEVTGIQEMETIVWFSTPGGQIDANDDVGQALSVTVPSDAEPGIVNIPVLAGDFDQSADTPAVVEFVSVEIIDQSTGGDDSIDGNKTSFITPDATSKTVTPGNSVTMSYDLTNPTSSETSILFELESLPTNLTLSSVDGDISQDLSESSPPGVITTAVPPNETATVSFTLTAAANATTETGPVLTKGTVDSSSGLLTSNVSVTVDITEADPLTSRFSGGDGRIDNLDVLRAVNAANSGTEIGGQPVTNLDVLQVVNRANAS